MRISPINPDEDELVCVGIRVNKKSKNIENKNKLIFANDYITTKEILKMSLFPDHDKCNVKTLFGNFKIGELLQTKTIIDALIDSMMPITIDCYENIFNDFMPAGVDFYSLKDREVMGLDENENVLIRDLSYFGNVDNICVNQIGFDDKFKDKDVRLIAQKIEEFMIREVFLNSMIFLDSDCISKSKLDEINLKESLYSSALSYNEQNMLHKHLKVDEIKIKNLNKTI